MFSFTYISDVFKQKQMILSQIIILMHWRCTDDVMCHLTVETRSN